MLREEWRVFQKDIHCNPIIVLVLVNQLSFAHTMVNTRCLTYGLCDPSFASRWNLERLEIKPFYMEAFDGEKAARSIREVAVTDIDLEGFTDRV